MDNVGKAMCKIGERYQWLGRLFVYALLIMLGITAIRMIGIKMIDLM